MPGVMPRITGAARPSAAPAALGVLAERIARRLEFGALQACAALVRDEDIDERTAGTESKHRVCGDGHTCLHVRLCKTRATPPRAPVRDH